MAGLMSIELKQNDSLRTLQLRRKSRNTRVYQEAESLTRMKRPMIDNVNVELIQLEGGHATPLLAPPLEVADKVQDLLGEQTAKDALLYSQTDATVNELVRWLEEANL